MALGNSDFEVTTETCQISNTRMLFRNQQYRNVEKYMEIHHVGPWTTAHNEGCFLCDDFLFVKEMRTSGGLTTWQGSV